MQKINRIIRSIFAALFALIHVYFIILSLKASTGKEIEAHYLFFKQPMKVIDISESDSIMEYGNVIDYYEEVTSQNKTCLRAFQSYSEEINEEKRYYSLIKEDAFGYQYFSFKTFLKMTLYPLFVYHPLYPLAKNSTSLQGDCGTNVYGLSFAQWFVSMLFFFISVLGYMSMYFISLQPYMTISYGLLFIDAWYSYRISTGPSKTWYAIDIVVFLLILAYLYCFRQATKEKMSVKLKMFKCDKKITKNLNAIKRKQQKLDNRNHNIKVQPLPLVQPPNIVYSPYTQNIYNANSNDSAKHLHNRNPAGIPQVFMHL